MANKPAVPDDTVKQVVKTKQKSQLKSDRMAVHTNPGDNSKFISHNLQLMGMTKPDMTDAEAIRQRIIEYFTICEKNDMKPSVEGMALAFGVERRSLYRWVNGINCSYITQEGRNYLKTAYATLNAMMSDYMMQGKINPVSGIFLMKNNMNYSDQTEIIVTPNNPLGAEVSAEEVQKRITEGVIVEVPQDD